MKMSALRRLLKDEPACNPFTDKFDFQSMIDKIGRVPPADLAEESLIEAPRIAELMHRFYKDFYAYLSKNLKDSNISFFQLVDLLLTTFNRDYLVLFRRRNGQSNKRRFEYVHQMYNEKIETNNRGMGKVEPNSALEAEVDALNKVVSYMRYFANEPIAIDESLPEVRPVEAAKKMVISGTMFVVMKEEYENVVWNGGLFKVLLRDNKYRIDFIQPDAELLVLNKVGFIRLQQNSDGNSVREFDEVLRKTVRGRHLLEMTRLRKKLKRIKRVWVANGFIEFALSNGFGKNECLTELGNVVELSTFYGFLDNVNLPAFPSLSLVDLVRLYSLVQDLVREAAKIEFDDSMFSMSDLVRFPVRIQKRRLFEYLHLRSDFSINQINVFLDLICHSVGDQINLWDKPLVEYRDTIYLNMLPTLNPILLNLVDYWLDKGGFSLDERGKMLEKHLEEKVGKALAAKRFSHFIPKRKKIQTKQGKYEEIDLLLNLQSIVVVGEAKCIKYPLEARDRHNSLKRLTAAARQVLRKVNFLREYTGELIDQIGVTDGKTYFPIVITNYPLFTSYIVEGVIVTDFYLFESYFASGKLTDIRFDGSRPPQEFHTTSYYQSERELNDNLPDFFRRPPPVENLRPMFEIRDFKISLDSADIDINVTSAQFKDETADKN